MSIEKNQNANAKYLWVVLIAVIFVVGVVFIFAKYQKRPEVPSAGTGIVKPKEKISEVKKFANEQDFQNYLEKAKNISGSYGGRGGGGAGGPGFETMSAEGTGLDAEPSRISETNVQAAGIDEPDTVKTDGKEIFSSISRSQFMPLDYAPGGGGKARSGETKAVKVFPPDALDVDSKIDKSGDLLLIGKILVVIPAERYYWSQSANKIYGYDVSDPAKPKEIWNIELKNSASIAGARAYNGKIYLAIKTDIVDEKSCLLTPLVVKGAEYSLKCTDVWHPGAVVPTDAVFTAMTIDPSSGGVEKSVSFTGTNDFTSSVVYMSPNALYLTYYDPGDAVKILYSFFSENKDLAPDWLIQKLKNLEGYDISASAKMTEIWELIARYQNSLSNDDRLKVQNEMANRTADYLKNHRRNLDSTGIVKIKTDDLSIDSTGIVSGKLLNQFSLDEYKGDLRAATTVGENFLSWGFGFASNNNASNVANDVYILGDGLKTEGSVIDLGQGERIYAVRFIEDKGYVVTFRQTDPFYVLDLADPMNPAKRGELKIPGYSSYLHPIAKNRILGVGMENNKVKLSLFDVADPADPAEISKYNLDEYWSEVSETHHAFLQDVKHQVFFLPGPQGGYVFSYAGDNLKLVKAVSDIQAERAVYINDFLYVIGEDKIVVLDENNWEKVGELDL